MKVYTTVINHIYSMPLSQPEWTTSTWFLLVLNATARLISGTRKYDRGLSQLLHTNLHWLDVADRARFKLAVTVHRCLHSKVPKYLTDCCVAVSNITDYQRLHALSTTSPAISKQHPAVRHSLSLDQPSGIHCQTNSKMRVRRFF